MEEIYKDVPGYEGLYQVSNYGNVKRDNRILKPIDNGQGYYFVTLSKNNKRKTHKIHQLVAVVFLNHVRDGYNTVINHIDNNPLNNYVGNLEIVSPRYNSTCHRTDVGASWHKRDKKWSSKIFVDGKSKHLGNFNTKEEAVEAYQKALATIKNTI